MKKRIPALLLFCLLMLSGCTSMLERSYVSSTPHVDYSVTEDASILRAETYQGLVNSILHFINERADIGTIRLYNYTGDVEADLSNACDEVLHEDPLGAYSVRSLTYDSTRILTYYEVDLSITYARSADDVAAIRETTGLSGLQQELNHMVAARQSKLALLVSYFTDDAALVEELLRLAYFNTPDMVIQPASLTVDVSFYPEKGTRRIIDIRVNWAGHDESSAAQYSRQLTEDCAKLFSAYPPAAPEEGYTVEELAAMVRAVCPAYDYHGAQNAAGPLSGKPAEDTGLLLAMEYLCQRAGIDATTVLGSGPHLMWLIVETPDGYRHLLPSSLRPGEPVDNGTPNPAAPTEPAESPFALYTDAELLEMGYSWSGWLYPSCVSAAPVPAE